MNGTEYESLLAAAATMSPREAADHYHNLAQQWYRLQDRKALRVYSKHIVRITKLLHSKERLTRLDAIRALAFIVLCPRLHRKLFEYGVLYTIVATLNNSQEDAYCEAALVVLNHLCNQSSRTQPRQFQLVTDFCKNKQCLAIIFKFAHFNDHAISIIANVMSVIAALCDERRLVFISLSAYSQNIYCLYIANVQEYCVRAGIMERAFYLKTYRFDRIVRQNVELFLKAMHLEHYSVDKFKFCFYVFLCVWLCI